MRILIPADLDVRLRLEAARRGVPQAAVSREALEAYPAPQAASGPLRFFSVGDGAPDYVSEHADDVVADAISRRNPSAHL